VASSLPPPPMLTYPLWLATLKLDEAKILPSLLLDPLSSTSADKESFLSSILVVTDSAGGQNSAGV
jgi:hypothetical protein